MTAFIVYKRDHTGSEMLSYPGYVIERGTNFVCIEAIFTSRDRVEIGGLLTLSKGDRMLEWFYADRWYNIFQVHVGKSEVIKGWYCNITRPATITENTVAADDLALDLIVTPSGMTTVLDEDEFDALDLSPAEHASAMAAVHALRDLVINRQSPFAALTPNRPKSYN